MKIKWNMKGFEEVRRSEKVDDMLQEVVDGILQSLPNGYEGDVSAGRTRSRGGVWTADIESIIDNEENQSLLTELNKTRVG